MTVAFGPSGSTNSANFLSFAAFRDKYLRSGDDGGNVLAASITSGQVPPPATDTGVGRGSGQQGTADDGTATRPWRVGPEFCLLRADPRRDQRWSRASRCPVDVTGRHLDLGPAGKRQRHEHAAGDRPLDEHRRRRDDVVRSHRS